MELTLTGVESPTLAVTGQSGGPGEWALGTQHLAGHAAPVTANKSVVQEC